LKIKLSQKSVKQDGAKKNEQNTNIFDFITHFTVMALEISLTNQKKFICYTGILC